MSVAVTSMGIGIAVVMLTGPSLIAAPVDLPVFAALSSGDGENIFPSILNLSVRLALVVSIVVESVELVKTVFNLFRGKTPIISFVK